MRVLWLLRYFYLLGDRQANSEAVLSQISLRKVVTTVKDKINKSPLSIHVSK